MRRRVVRSVGACILANALAVGLLLLLAAPPGEAQEASPGSLIWPSDKVTLTKGADGKAAEGSIIVVNPTGSEIRVAAANAEPCALNVTPAKVAAHRSATLKVTLVTTDSCRSLDAVRNVSLTAGGETVMLDAEVTEPEQKTTGITWSVDDVFLVRHGGKSMMGWFTVTNTTDGPIDVWSVSFDGKCEPKSRTRAVTVQAGKARRIPVSGDPGCKDLDRGSITLTTRATAGGTSEVHPLTVSAQTNWSRFGLAWLLCVGGGLVAALGVLLVTWRGDRTILPLNPLRADADAPKSWLTAVAGTAPFLAALVTNGLIVKGVTGLDSNPQSPLIVVAGAIGVAVLGVAGIVVAMPFRTAVVDGKAQGCPTVLQFTIATGLVAGAAGFELWAIGIATSRLDLPIARTARILVVLVFALTLMLYARRLLIHYLHQYGTTAEETISGPDAELIAAFACCESNTSSDEAAALPGDDGNVRSRLLEAARAAALADDASKVAGLERAEEEAKAASEAFPEQKPGEKPGVTKQRTELEEAATNAKKKFDAAEKAFREGGLLPKGDAKKPDHAKALRAVRPPLLRFMP